MSGELALEADAVTRTRAAARRLLLEARLPAGHWEGHLSSSALSTATAVCALELVRRHRPDAPESLGGLVARGLAWLASHQNADGGYGDTTDSPSNISTTTLCWAALGMVPGQEAAAGRAGGWLKKDAGDLSPGPLARTIADRYGKDRTFSTPILTMCALSGRFGAGREAWSSVPGLPFELAMLPRSWFGALGLRVVSYALPALIAIGQAIHHHHPPGNPLTRLLRNRARAGTLRLLEAIQPASGGFLEATPLTSFVTMSLAGSGLADHAVARKAVGFLIASAREDGSWAIDSNLATWITTLSVHAVGDALSAGERRRIRDWLLRQQHKEVHPYTGAAPGGWAWTDLSGGVPDADDTPGAMLALSRLADPDDLEVKAAASSGVRWLIDLQNSDGGVPTFCRGWGKLPFDQSCPDLTAHAIRAWSVWAPGPAAPAIRRAFDYLVRVQQSDGSWIPLWFGNQRAPEQANPVYGTSRVLLCAGLDSGPAWTGAVRRAKDWLVRAQRDDGGFGGAPGLEATIEETALAVEGLAVAGGCDEAVVRGRRWLVQRTAEGTRFEPSPIGLYFARLWYWDRLYPLIFTVAALGRGPA
ncbi:MAG TPA: prenyltransferase/squalene oxidase repeat-containing protein [Planctomycetota bacterium]|nr:prenyltransferase/squalene oxidase repeat-containing protein [Planctomycetota bacterium]